MKYLVDANVLSEPAKPAPDPRVVAWLRAHEPDIAVDPVILGELRFGILILPKGRKRTALDRWFDAGVGRLHCLPWDADTGLKWAETGTGDDLALADQGLAVCRSGLEELELATAEAVRRVEPKEQHTSVAIETGF